MSETWGERVKRLDRYKQRNRWDYQTPGERFFLNWLPYIFAILLILTVY